MPLTQVVASRGSGHSMLTVSVPAPGSNSIARTSSSFSKPVHRVGRSSGLETFHSPFAASHRSGNSCGSKRLASMYSSVNARERSVASASCVMSEPVPSASPLRPATRPASADRSPSADSACMGTSTVSAR